MTISFSGLASGLDTTSWVESLVKLKQAKVTTLQQQKESAILSRDTLTSIRTFFNSFRSVLQKITDSRFNVANMDLFAQNIATSSKLNILTATATTEAEEASYKVKVDKLASKTSAVSEFKGTTTIVEKTTATSDTKLSRLGVTAGDIVVLAPDGQQYEISIGTNDTIQTLVDKLAIYGVEASFNNNTGIFNINLNASDIEDGTTGLKTALNLSDVENGYITRNQLITTKEEIGTIAPTLETAIGELGVNSGQLTINTGAGEINIDITSTMTFAGLISELESNNIHATYDHNTGVFELTGAEIVDDGDTNLISAFGLDLASSSTVNADENYYLSDFGFTGENVQVTLHREGDVATSITVNGSDTIGDFITNLNSNGVNASIENGVITIENGYIENNALETALGLTKDVGGSYCIISDSVVETIKETATGASKLGDIIRALGTESVVEDGYELVFNGQTINVSETTTINDIISEVNAIGGNATIDASGNLTINDGILTGSVAESLGITNINTRIDIYGETSLYAKITVTATPTPTTTLDYLGVRTSITPEFTNSITQLTQTQAEAAGYTWVTTQEELTAALVTNNSSVKVMLGADIAISDWETIGSSDSTKFKGELNGNGHKITGLNTTLFYGLSGATVKNLGFENITSTAAVLASSADGRIENCYVSNATISFSGYRGILVDSVPGMSSLVIDSCNIYNSSIASSNQVAGGFIGQVLKSDITIQNSGIYNSSVSGTSGAGAFIGKTHAGSLDSNIAIQNCTTSASLTGDTVGLIGIDNNSGGGAREISNITYDSKDYYDRDQYEGQFITPGLGKELAVYDSNKCLVGTIDMTGTSTIQDLFDELSSYGITGSINNSVITLTSTNGNFVAGQVIDDLGLEFSTTNGTTTVGLDVTSANSIYYTETIIATGSTTLGQLGIITGTPLDKYLKETGFVKMTATEANSLGYTQVTTAEELHTALSNNENVVLMNDIDLSGYNWEQINSYNATLDGNGYSIKNLSMTDVESGGMFSNISGCIKNLNITNANIEAADDGDYIAVLTGNITGTATNIFIDGNVTANGCYASGFADFYAPDSSSNYLENIWVDVSTNNNNGISSGFISVMEETNKLNISNITTSGTLTGNEVYGFGCLSVDFEWEISNISSYAELEGNKNYLLTNDESVHYITNGKFDYRVNPHLDTISGITQANISGSMNEISILSKTGDYIGKIDIDENTTLDDLSMALSSYGITAELSAEGVLNITSSSKRMVSGFVAEQLGISYNDRTESSITIGAANTSYSKVVFTNTTKASNTSTLGSINFTRVINGTITASGVDGDVIGISSASELKMLADLVNSGESMSGKTFVLTSDIDLSGYENWESIEGFKGNFQGQGYTISGLKQTLNSTNNQSGLFIIYEGGVVQELKISNANITVEDSYTSNVLGFLAGTNMGTINGITIESSTITGTATNISFVGAISGQTSNGTIKNCKTMDDIDLGTHSNAYLGGIVGVIATGGYIENCENNININSTNTAGGIVGEVYYNTFSSCNTTIMNCLNNGNITATNHAGGIVGVVSTDTLGSSNTLTLEDCVNTGKLNGTIVSSFISRLYCSSNPNNYTYNVNMTDCYSTFTDNGTSSSNLSSAFSITANNTLTYLDLATVKTKLDSTSAGKFAYDADSGNLTVLRSNIWSLYSVDASGAATLIDINGSTTIQELDAMLDNWSFNTSTSKGAVSSGSLVGGCASKLKNITMYSYTPEVLTEETSITKSLSGEDLHTSFAIVFTEAETGNTIKETLFLGCGDESCTVTNCSTSTIHTYGDFLDVFRNHGIEAYIENGKVYINAEDDVYYSVSVLTGGTISSAYTTLMSDLELSTRMGNTVNISSTTYNTSTTSSELKYTTYRQMGTDSKLEDLASAVGQTTNGLRIGIVSNGSSLGMTTASSAGWTTMQDVIDYLETNGIEAYISDGKITVNSSEDSYILSCNNTFTNACGITGNSQVVTSTIYASTSESNDLSKIEYPDMDLDIKLENIIATNGSTLDSYELVLNTKSLDNEDLSYTITFDATSTLGDVETWLDEKGVDLTFESYGTHDVILLNSTNYADFSLSGDLGDYLLGNSTKMYRGTNTASNLEQQEMMNESSILSDFGVTNGSIEVYVNGVKNTLNIDSSKSYSNFKTQLLSLGIDSSINEMGEMTLNSMVPGDKISFVTPISGGSNIAEILSINAYEEGVQFAQAGTKLTLNRNQVSIATESITEVPVVVDENTLISDFDNGLVVSEGTLSVTVDGVKSNIRITEDETFGSFMEKLRNVGLESSLVNGELLIHNNNQEFTINIDESTSNIMTLLGIESNDTLTGYSSSEDTITKNTSIVEERNYSVSSWANNTTQLNLLGITDGSFSVFRDGKKETLTIDSTKTFENLQTQLNDKFGEDLELTFEDGYLKISSKTGAKVEVNSSTDTSNFAAITGISSDGKKSVISARQLYNVNTESKLTDTGLFRRGTVAEGTFTIGDAEFTIDENTTLANIISQINNTENAGAIAYWDTVDGKLVLTSKSNGATLINIEAGSSNFTDILGFTSSQWADVDGDLNPDVGESSATITKINVNTQTLGDNASFYINGTHFTSTSNTVSSDVSRIKGLTLELKNISEGEEVIVTVKKDNDSLANAVQEVVDSYNTLITNIDKQIEQGSPLNNEFTLKLLRNQIRSMMTSTVSTGSTFKNLSSIGITTGEAVSGNISTEGLDTLTFDKEKFMEAYSSDSLAVKTLLVGEDGSSGLFNQIESIVTQAESANGYFSSAQNSYNKQIQNITSKISRAETSVARYRSRLESKFASMDLLISQMQNNYSSFLSA